MFFVLYLSCDLFIILLHCRCIYVCINTFVNIIFMFIAIYLRILYDLLLGCTTSWKYCRIYFLYMIYSTIVSPYQLAFIHYIWLAPIFKFYHLVIASIETHWFVPNSSIYHIFCSPLFFCCLIILGKLYTFNIQHSKTYNQHHIYFVFDQISCYSHPRLHTAPVRETNDKLGCFYIMYFISRGCLNCYRFQKQF